MIPQLAINWIRERVTFPCIAQPKIDGVRGGQFTPALFTGRSLEPFANRALTKFWSNPDFKFLDGELVLAGKPWDTDRLCSHVTSMTNTQVGHPERATLVAFDYMLQPQHPYKLRLQMLAARVAKLQELYDDRVQMIESHYAQNLDHLLELDEQFLDRGLEGTIIRDPDLPVKPGRSSKTAMHLWRIKRFIDFEIIITRFDAALENRNEQKINALGRHERSTHKANKHPKEMVGTVYGRVLKNVVHEGKLLFQSNMEIAIGPGRMTHDFRKLAFAKPELLVEQLAKVKTLPYGIKDKPRMPTFECLRSLKDM